MTDPNKFNPYPDIATIRCPSCGEVAEFRRGISLVGHREWPWWAPRLWPCARATDWDGKERWAPGDAPPEWRGWIVLEHDPALFRWKKPPRGYKGTDEGVIACSRCVGRRAHVLRWPDDAYYRFDLPQGQLWAWDRAGAEALVDFIASAERDPGAHRGHFLFLRHVPKAFLGAKDREMIVRRIRRELARRGSK